MVVNFPTRLLMRPAIHEITRSIVATPDQVTAFTMMYTVVLLPVLVPVVLASVLVRRADGLLNASQQWVDRNARIIGPVIEAAFANYLLTKGERALR
jgi:hypothetical protein